MKRAWRLARTPAIVAVTMLTYVCAAAALASVIVLEWTSGDVDEIVNTAGFGTAFLGLPAVGAVLAVHRPANPIGRTILGFGAGMYVLLLVDGATDFVTRGMCLVEGTLLWTAGILSAFTPVLLWLMVHLVLYFPNGEVEGRSRWLSRIATAVITVLVVARLLRPAPLDVGPLIVNPFGRVWAAPVDRLVGPLTVALLLLAVVALARLVVRFRRAAPVERAQFRWILASLGVIPITVVVGATTSIFVPTELAATVVIIGGYNLGVLGFSYSLHRAVTRRDLYGIGRVVGRTVTYAVLVALLALTYLALVIVLGAVASAATRESGDLVVALSTLAVAAIFQPVRSRVTAAVDRRFDRAAYDAARTIDDFGRGLRDELGLTAVVEQLGRTAATTFRPRFAGVTLVATEVDP